MSFYLLIICEMNLQKKKKGNERDELESSPPLHSIPEKIRVSKQTYK